MTASIDYSRPVGWWCTNCEEDGPCTRTVNLMGWCCDRIPVYLLIPEGQRPTAASEVEEAEVVTFSNPTNHCRLAESGVALTADGWIEDGEAWADADEPDVDEVNCIAEMSKCKRIVTGATE